VELVAAVLTSPFEGGIGVVLVAGKGALALVAERFRPARPGAVRGGAPRYGWLHEAGRPESVVDEVLVRVRDDAGLEAVEISGHGGRASVRTTLRLLADAGVREIGAAEMTRRLSLAAGLDLVQIEALEALPDAASLAAAELLLDALDGSLSRAAVAAAGDREAVREILERAPRGLALVASRAIVLLGRPNAGKSSLFNALVGRDRAITSPVPGTTRDLLEQTIVARGFPIRIVDSAGIEAPRDRVQSAAIDRSLDASRAADLRVVVLDGSLPETDEDRRVLDEARRCGPAIVVETKCDLPRRLARSAPAAARTSAVTGAGLDELLERVCETLGLEPLPRGAPAPFTARQIGALEALAAGEASALRSLLGGAGPGRVPRGVFP
jgi:tRNA modification GTPase